MKKLRNCEMDTKTQRENWDIREIEKWRTGAMERWSNREIEK